MDTGEHIKIFCSECAGHTNHNILAKKKIDSETDDGFHYGVIHYFGQCAGCDNICYAQSSWTEDQFDPETGEMLFDWQTYPRSKGQRSPIDDIHYLPMEIRIIYREAVGAFNNQLHILAAIGLRVLVEAICKERKVGGDNLALLIDGLAQNGILSRNQADILHSHRFMGNAAAHEIQIARPTELIAALEISETVLRTIYVLPELSKKIRTGRKRHSQGAPTASSGP